MMSTGLIKRRYEIKYLVDHHKAIEFEKRIAEYMYPDPNMSEDEGRRGYYNHSIYFDNPRNRFYLEKHEGNLERIKPRIRGYRPHIGVPPSSFFLELKNRADRVVHKERSAINFDLVRKCLRQGVLDYSIFDSNDLVQNKFYYLWKRFNLTPVVAVNYHRRAFFSNRYPGLRITFDSDLQASRNFSFENKRVAYRYVLSPQQQVIEIKYNKFIPRALLLDIQKFEIQQSTYSKFAAAVETNSAAKFNLKRCYLD